MDYTTYSHPLQLKPFVRRVDGYVGWMVVLGYHHPHAALSWWRLHPRAVLHRRALSACISSFVAGAVAGLVAGVVAGGVGGVGIVGGGRGGDGGGGGGCEGG